MNHILIIDDDIHINNMLDDILKKNNYKITHAYSGTEALLILDQISPDLILLDLMLPGLSGEEVIKRIHNIPVIIISAKVSVDDKVSLLLNGAMDYITKPFDINELLARIIVHLRKNESSEYSDHLSFHDLTLHCPTHEVYVGTNIVRLTRTEYAILKLLLQNSSQVLTKSALLEQISSDTPDCTESSLKIHVSNLRRKLRTAGGKEYLEAVWGIGYKMISI